jgi:hypothetical protein
MRRLLSINPLNAAILFGISSSRRGNDQNAIAVTDVVLHCGNLGMDTS